jgi:hypothetical protein
VTGYLTITRICGDPAELLAGYRRSAELMTGVGRDHGLILHAAAQTDDGLLIANLWPSEEGSEAAVRDQRRLSVVAEHGLTPDQIRRSHYQVADYVLFGPHRRAET